MVSSSNLLLAISTFSGIASAFWRLPCHERVGLARMDPIMNPGQVSGHVHALHGGGNFGFNTTSYDLLESTCTSCEITQDKSAYWTPPLYFMYKNGTAKMVQQVGGMLAYYLLYTDGSSTQTVTAFPRGFQMISGDTDRRNFTCAVPEPPKSLWSGFELTQPALQQKALGFNCLNYGGTPEPSLGRHYLPDKSFIDANCPDGLRLELMFPSCWNGKDTDSPDHRSHVAFPDLVMTGSCPPGFNTRLPSLFFETIWATAEFANDDGQFVLSNGDPTGYGYHGDFMEAWPTGFLQQAVDTCTNPSGQVQDCPLFNLQDDSIAAQCTFPEPSALAADNPAGPRQGLVGNIPIQAGPGPASPLVPNVLLQPTNTAASLSYLSALATSTAQTIVPTVQYSLAASTATDANGGGIVVAAGAVGTKTISAMNDSAFGHNVVPTSMSTSTITDRPIIASPAVTPSFVSTKWITSGLQEWEIFVEETLVTVTATTMETVGGNRRKQRRHGHAGSHGI